LVATSYIAAELPLLHELHTASADQSLVRNDALDFPAGQDLLVEAADSITPSSRPNSGCGGAASIAMGVVMRAASAISPC
jgi:hypothetical protein